MDCQAFTELDDTNYFPPKKTKKYGRHAGSNILCKLCFILGKHFNNSNKGFIIKLVFYLKGVHVNCKRNCMIRFWNKG